MLCRYIDIEDGVTEFHLGRTTTHYDHTLPARTKAHKRCHNGFEVYRTQAEALAAEYPDSAPLLLSPRVLLELLVGGVPRYCRCDVGAGVSRRGCARFMQVTPVRIVAEGARFAALFEEFLTGELRE